MEKRVKRMRRGGIKRQRKKIDRDYRERERDLCVTGD